MPEVIKISDSTNLVPTKNYPYGKWNFSDFNPVQSKLIDIYEGNSNVAIAAATSAGKTVCSELYIAYEVRKNKGKCIYVGPLKALAKEKEQDWTSDDHHFKDLNISIATGDCRLTTKRIKELDESDIIVMTPEMLASRCRSHNSDKSRFLYDVRCVVFDESHLLTVPKRGDHIEVALMKLVEINPDIRIVLLSATMPNVDEICGWVSKLTGRDTYYLESDYRPCPLSVHYETYYDGDNIYWEKEAQKVGTACAICEYYPDDKFLIFCHTIETGNTMIKSLLKHGIEAEFHNSTLDMKKRMDLENRFKNDKKFRVLVATSTLAWGCFRHKSILTGENGRPIRVEEVNVGDRLLCPVGGKYENRLVVKIQDFHKDEGYFVELETGEQMVVSTDHLFWAASKRKSPEWVCVEDIKKGDLLATPSDYGFWNKEIQYDDFWYLVGFGFGDGSITLCGKYKDGNNKFVLNFCLGERNSHSQFVSMNFNKLFNTNCIIRDDSNGVPYISTKRRSIVEKFVKILPNGRKNGTEKIPDELYENQEKAANFLSGWFDADGGVEKHDDKNMSVGLSCISKRSIMAARSLLLCFGIRSTMGRKKVKGSIIKGRYQKATRKWSYRLRIFGFESLEKFHRLIGFKHKNKSNKLVDYLKSISKEKSIKEIIPAREMILNHLEKNNMSGTDFKTITGSDLWNSVHKQDCNKSTIKKLIDNTIIKTELNQLFDSSIYWSRIKNIKKCNGGTFREIEVEDPHAYIGGNVISHNCNLPARRVVVVGCHRGLTEVENYDIQQMIGRAGRPKYDPRGDAYILVPETDKGMWIKKLKHKPPIRSTLLNHVGREDNPHYKVLAFHIVAEIHQGNVKTKDGFKQWFGKSLAHFQDHAFDDVLIDRTIEQLQQCRAVVLNDKGDYECTAIGKVASMFYYSPFDVSDLRRNFKFIFDEKKQSDDHSVSIALANIDSFRWTVCNKFEKEAIGQYQGKIDKMFGANKFTAGTIKHGAAFYYLLKGRRDISQIATLQGVLQADMDRTMQVLNAIDSMSSKWDKQDWFKMLALRLRYGVESDLVELCQIPNIGQARAKKLKANRIKTLDDFISYDGESLASIMKVSKKLAEESLEAAKLIKIKESI